MSNLPHSYIADMEVLQMENEQLRQRILTLENQAKNNEVLDLVSGCYYSVKLMTDDEYEPALATYLHGGICFQFFNGVVVSSDKVNGYKKLNYR